MTTISTTATANMPVPALSVAASPRYERLATGPSAPISSTPPTTQLSVTSETIAAIQDLTFESGRSPTGQSNEELTRQAIEEAAKPPAPEVKSIEQLQAEARRWERYYAHQPRRLADLLAVYYGGQGGSIDPRGQHAVPLGEEQSQSPPDAPGDQSVQ